MVIIILFLLDLFLQLFTRIDDEFANDSSHDDLQSNDDQQYARLQQWSILEQDIAKDALDPKCDSDNQTREE